MRSGAIAPEHILDQEMYFFLGLPALTLLEGVVQSLNLSPANAMVMSDGSIITEERCPPEFMPLYLALASIKQTLLEHLLSHSDLLTELRAAARAGLDSPAPLGGTSTPPLRPFIVPSVSAPLEKHQRPTFNREP